MNFDYKKAVKFSLKLVISLFFVAWLVLKVDWAQVWVFVKELNFLFVLLYVAVLLLGMLISAYKWQMLLAHKNIRISLKKSFQLYLTGAFINNFMPSTIGGDTYRAYQIGKQHDRYAAASSSVVFDRITGFFAVMLLTGVMAIFQWDEIVKYPELKFAIVGVLVAMHGIIFFGILTRFSFWKKYADRFPKTLQNFGKELVHYREGGVYLKSIGYSVLFSIVGLALVNWVLFSGLGVSIGIMQYLSVIFLISIISALPISINNIGLKEWGYVTFFGFFGVNASAVVAVALISRVLQMLVSFAALPFYLRNKNK